ncbi:MAG: ABC transporter substrate binding protein [Spirochaetales bacterium]
MKLALCFIAFAVVLASCGPSTPVASSSSAGNPSDAVASPRNHPEGRPFRVAVVQSGDYYSYNRVLASIHGGLADLGWTTEDSSPLGANGTIPQMLARWKLASGNVGFDPALFVDLKFTEDSTLPPALLALLNGSSGADLVISLGTIAGKFCAQAAKAGELKVPVLIESVSDPIVSGIITSVEDSGYDLLTASLDPDQDERQVRLFQRVIQFKHLGLIYTDTDTGRTYAALAVVTRLASELGFEIVADMDVLEDPPDEKDIPKAEAAFVQAFERLAKKKVDAVYLAIQAGLTSKSMPAIAALSEQYKIPTFAMEGVDFVRLGALMGESGDLLTLEGLNSARKLTRVLAGAIPRSLPQANPHLPHVILNQATAKAIGFAFPVDMLLAADEVITQNQPRRKAP